MSGQILIPEQNQVNLEVPDYLIGKPVQVFILPIENYRVVEDRLGEKIENSTELVNNLD